MKTTHLENIDHDYLRYANCWEDADVLLNELNITTGDRVLSIGSAGDNCFSLLVGSPDLVIAVDVNRVQLALIELKRAAIKQLDYEAFLEFLGFVKSQRRVALYEQLRPQLDEETREYWDGKKEHIEAGLIYQGKFEKYFSLFRKKVLPLIHSSKKIDGLFDQKTESAQNIFYDNKWNSLRWRGLFKLFFSKFVIGRLGRDPEFLVEVGVPVADFIYDQAGKQLGSKECQRNYFLDFILRGKFKSGLPHYARRNNFLIIKQNISRLQLKYGYAQEVALQHPGLNKFNLSNIFEYMDVATFKTVSDKLVSSAAQGARFAYWNLMVPRKMSTVTTVSSEYGTEMNDKGFFYSDFHINIKS